MHSEYGNIDKKKNLLFRFILHILMTGDICLQFFDERNDGIKTIWTHANSFASHYITSIFWQIPDGKPLNSAAK